jgi:hypothetical protein
MGEGNMFSGLNRIREFRGKVVAENEDTGTKAVYEQQLGNIEVRLYSARYSDIADMNRNPGDVNVLREKLAAVTRTNEKGEYTFYVGSGIYSLSINLDTLPEGKGVVNPVIYKDSSASENYDFLVRDVAEINADGIEGKVSPLGDRIFIRPVMKDKYGNNLAAKFSYSSCEKNIRLKDNVLKLSPDDFRTGKININVSAGNLTRKVTLDITEPDTSPEERINLALARGLIDEKTKIRNYLYLLFDRERLEFPYALRGNKPIKSGTAMMEEINAYITGSGADESLVSEVKRYLERAVPDLDKSYTSQGGFFNIHYTISGSNAVSQVDENRNGVPDYIESVGSAFDYSRSVTCSSRGFRFPVTDNGSEIIDIYVYDLKGKYGVTNSKKVYKNKKYGKRVATCYISIDNSYDQSKGFKENRDDCMKVTAAHEFFHAVQYAYNIDADSWWKEATATWNEDEVYNSVNDYYQYVEKIFSSPYKSLENFSYAGVVFVKYLSENLGGYGLVKRIWEYQAVTYDKSLSAIDRAIRETYPNNDIGTIYNEFTASNFNPSQYYREGSAWNISAAVQNTYSSYPVGAQYGSLDHLAANYQLFKPLSGKTGTVRITADGEEGVRWGFKLQKRKLGDNNCEVTYANLSEGESRVLIIVNNFGTTYGEVCLIPANLDKAADRVSYNYFADIDVHN